MGSWDLGYHESFSLFIMIMVADMSLLVFQIIYMAFSSLILIRTFMNSGFVGARLKRELFDLVMNEWHGLRIGSHLFLK